MKEPLRYALPAIVFTALMHTLCCVVPLVALLLGSGSWLISLHEVALYKPYLIALNVLLLGFAFYRVYVAARPCVHQKRERIAVWLAAALSGAMLLTEPILQNRRDEGSRLAAAQMQVIMNTRQVILQIEPLAITDELRAIPGVLRVEQSTSQHIIYYNRKQTSVRVIVRTLRQKGWLVREVPVQTMPVSSQ